MQKTIKTFKTLALLLSREQSRSLDIMEMKILLLKNRQTIKIGKVKKEHIRHFVF